MTILSQDLLVDKQIKLARAEKKAAAELERKKLKITRIEYVLFSQASDEWADVNSVNIMADGYEQAEAELMKHIPTAAIQKNHFKITSRQEHIQTIDLISEPVKRRLYEWLKREFENGKK